MRHLSVIAFASLLVTNSFASPQSDFKAFMKGMIPKVERAFAKKDVGFFDSIAAPDFVDKSMGQTANRKQAMAEMKSQMKMVQSMSIEMKLVSANVSGGEGHAVLTGVGTFTMKPAKGAKAQATKMKFKENQTWVRSGSTWKLKVLEEFMGDK